MSESDGLVDIQKLITGMVEAAARPVPPPETVYGDTVFNSEYAQSRNLLVAHVTTPTGKSAKLVCRRHPDYNLYVWFIEDDLLGLIPLEDLSGETLAEAKSEFCLFFRELHDGSEIHARWYRRSSAGHCSIPRNQLGAP